MSEAHILLFNNTVIVLKAQISFLHSNYTGTKRLAGSKNCNSIASFAPRLYVLQIYGLEEDKTGN